MTTAKHPVLQEYTVVGNGPSSHMDPLPTTPTAVLERLGAVSLYETQAGVRPIRDFFPPTILFIQFQLQ